MTRTSRTNRGVAYRRGLAHAGVLLGTAAVIVTGVALMRFQSPLGAQSTAPTYAENVAPILFANCTSCHRTGGLGPFSLMDYDSVKANALEVRDAVETGYMPPWHAEGPHGTFRNDRRLSEADKQTILNWIDAGSPRGDMTKLPAKPVYPTGWEIGTPDAIVTMTNDFVVPASGTVAYQYFEVPTNFAEDKWVQALEILPGARDVVHHVLVYAKVPPSAAPAAAAAAAATPTPAASATPRPAAAAQRPLFVNKPEYNTPDEPPRADQRNAPPRQLGALIGSTAPGTNVIEFPAGTALRIRAGTVLTFQMHYTAHGHEMKDKTSMGFRFAPAPPTEEIRAAAFINGVFKLPAGERDIAVKSELEPTRTVRIWGLLPHTHLRGVKWQYEVVKPDGTKTVVLDVPRYDFNWQTYYFFATPLELTAGSRLVSTAWYDNSATNVHNPDATKDVWWGEQTWEEMQYTGYLYSVPVRQAGSPGN